jgi:CheY-like chemotaxis protein/anti-sigma regulatory factor (Ser/Thr protein kinase)
MFLSIISHDLRSPIGSISLILNDVAKSGADLTDEIFSVLCRASKNTELLLENLLSWAISHNGEIVSKPTNFPIIESVQHSMELLQSSARQKNIELTMDIAPTLYVYADVEMLNTIIRNLLNNAIKYTRSNGNVMIAAHENQGMLNLIVTDNGVGIADEIQQNLFNPGNKVHTSLGTADERGTGMGLALCAEFIKINRGSISVESHQGKGSEFICTLPLGVATATPQVDIALLKDWMVLVVEDNPLHQTSTRQALQSIGLEAIIACNGNEAVNIALRDKPKLVFMDFDLPDTTGDLIALQIREQSINPPGMIIALTSYSKAEFEKKSTKSQFDGCLRKPLKSSELLACIVPLILSSNDSRIQLANTTDGLMPKNT